MKSNILTLLARSGGPCQIDTSPVVAVANVHFNLTEQKAGKRNFYTMFSVPRHHFTPSSMPNAVSFGATTTGYCRLQPYNIRWCKSETGTSTSVVHASDALIKQCTKWQRRLQQLHNYLIACTDNSATYHLCVHVCVCLSVLSRVFSRRRWALRTHLVSRDIALSCVCRTILRHQPHIHLEARTARPISNICIYPSSCCASSLVILLFTFRTLCGASSSCCLFVLLFNLNLYHDCIARFCSVSHSHMRTSSGRIHRAWALSTKANLCLMFNNSVWRKMRAADSHSLRAEDATESDG